MKSGAGVLVVASLQLVVAVVLLGIYEGYKVWSVAKRPASPAGGAGAGACRRQAHHQTCAQALNRTCSLPLPRCTPLQTKYFNSSLGNAGEGLTETELKLLIAGEWGTPRDVGAASVLPP